MALTLFVTIVRVKVILLVTVKSNLQLWAPPSNTKIFFYRLVNKVVDFLPASLFTFSGIKSACSKVTVSETIEDKWALKNEKRIVGEIEK